MEVRESVERIIFEAWCKVRNDADSIETIINDDGDVYYADVNIEQLWQGWLARAYVMRTHKR